MGSHQKRPPLKKNVGCCFGLLLARLVLSHAEKISRKTREEPSTRIRIFLKTESFFLRISLSSSLVTRRSLLTPFSARSVTSQFTVESTIDLAENVRGPGCLSFVRPHTTYTHILVLRASWGPEHEHQEALPGGTQDLES